jgi:hypothetical protein
VRKFAKIALIVCLVMAAIPVALYASFRLWFWYETAKVDNFYRENRLLGEMRDGEKQSTNDSSSARDALLKMVPLGTDRDTVIAFLRKERLGCKATAEQFTDAELRERLLKARGLTNRANNNRKGNELVNCQAVSPNVMGHAQWIVYVFFDDEGHLADARVAIWNIFL